MPCDQPEFDFGGEPCSQAGESPAIVTECSDLPYSTWREVPQALFLSWSPAMQLAYCARRDEDAILSAESDWWVVFYGRRMEGYRGDMAKLAER
jgi:hypothetical protein